MAMGSNHNIPTASEGNMTQSNNLTLPCKTVSLRSACLLMNQITLSFSLFPSYMRPGIIIINHCHLLFDGFIYGH